MMLKEKSISGFIWSFINTGGTQLLGVTVGIVLARLLEPSDFGNIALVLFFTNLANVFVDSGFSHALIREQDTSQDDYSSVFYFGLFVSLICAVLLYVYASNIAQLYNKPILSKVSKVLALSPIIHAFMSVNSTIVTKNLNFKLKTKLSLPSIIIASIIAIIMAFNDYGIWSLVVMQLINPFILMVLLWVYVSWRPKLKFSINSIKKYLSFGIKLSISNYINVFYKSVYVIVIGKSYSSSQVGFFTRADSLKNLPTITLDKIIQRVSYPLLSKIKDSPSTLLVYNIKIIKFTALIVVPVMFGMAAVSEPLIVTLVGEKWLPATEFLTYLCGVGVFYPFHSANMNVIKVHGNMNLFLKLDIFKILLLLPVLYIGATAGITEMLIGMIIHSIVIFLISGYVASKIIFYKLSAYLKDIGNIFLFSSIMSISVYVILEQLSLSYQLELLIGICMGIAIMCLFYYYSANQEYKEAKKYVVYKIK
jgi:teichuronic acid exporter